MTPATRPRHVARRARPEPLSRRDHVLRWVFLAFITGAVVLAEAAVLLLGVVPRL